MNNHDTYVTLDIGTSTVRVIIGEIANGTLNIIGVGEAESEGIRKGSIVDIDETVRSIRAAVEKAERMVGLKVENIIVGVSGNHVQLQPCHGVVAVSSEDREIGDEDIIRVIDAAQVVSIPPEREIVNVHPKQFIVDGLDEINDPRGMIGVRLEMEGTIITASRTMLHNLLRCVEKAGLNIADIALQPLAAGSFALLKDERSLGCALVDIGGGSITVSVFKNNVLQGTTVLPFGGDHVTNDISVCLRTSTAEAEKVKREYGCAYIDLASEDEVFEVSEIGSDELQEYSQADLAEIIEPRMAEMLGLVHREVQKLGFRDVSGGYVLTGGCVKMPGLLELAREILQKNVRVAIPDYIGVREPQYTNGVGLIQYAHRSARIQGKEIAAGVAQVEHEPAEERQERSAKKHQKPKQQATQKQQEEAGVKKRMSKLFKVFFE
ncbi:MULTISPECIES: cell division protein FtsA [Alteribacter]|uniref:Cell division protein FtsA n=1 Tax=Alteribacter keqinensis TaxID=2483800 RepID=A0A3M7TW25_9BACI|nr:MULTISPECIES: cell division protein FtsA [Alteribacter]MBM7095859.1 cell division protein FtsA [Alteribacter salitolerans]RNA69683.1 cell division protein FtsA [Alteribacter keqinensis]